MLRYLIEKNTILIQIDHSKWMIMDTDRFARLLLERSNMTVLEINEIEELEVNLSLR